MDNGRVHHAGKVYDLFNKRKRMKLLFLPSYSPDINPEEYLHNHLRNKLLNNHNFKSTKQIGHTVSHFAGNMTHEEIKSIATLVPIESLLSVQKWLWNFHGKL